MKVDQLDEQTTKHRTDHFSMINFFSMMDFHHNSISTSTSIVSELGPAQPELVIVLYCDLDDKFAGKYLLCR